MGIAGKQHEKCVEENCQPQRGPTVAAKSFRVIKISSTSLTSCLDARFRPSINARQSPFSALTVHSRNRVQFIQLGDGYRPVEKTARSHCPRFRYDISESLRNVVLIPADQDSNRV